MGLDELLDSIPLVFCIVSKNNIPFIKINENKGINFTKQIMKHLV